MKEKSPLVLTFIGRGKVGKTPAKRKRATSFWTPVFFCDLELPDITLEEFCLNDNGYIEILGKKTSAEKLAKARLKELNADMLHPEDRPWRYKLVELTGGKK